MKKTIIIKSDKLKDRACEIINGLSLDPLHEVRILPHKVDRSLMQNAYYWRTITIIGADLGYSKEEMHRQYKSSMLVPIMLKYPDDYPEFAEMVAAIQELRATGSAVGADKIAKLSVALVSTSKLLVNHMAEYIDDVVRHAASLDVRLPAMGDK